MWTCRFGDVIGKGATLMDAKMQAVELLHGVPAVFYGCYTIYSGGM